MYCDYLNRANLTVVHILGSFLHQLLPVLPAIPKEVHKHLKAMKLHSRKLDHAGIIQMLKRTLTEFQQVFICIDALDELDCRACIGLLTTLQKELGTVKVFTTGRPTVTEMVNRTLGMSTRQTEPIIIKAHADDLRSFLLNEIQVDQEINPGAMNSNLKVEIVKRL